MSEYTPTTDEVREDFAYPWEGFKQNREGRLAAFDRWHQAELRRAKAEAWRELVVRLAYFEGLDLNEYPNPYQDETAND